MVVLAANPREVEDVVAAACDDAGALLVRARDDVTADVRMVDGRAELTVTTPLRSYGTLRLSLAGRHQADNAMTTIRLLEALASTRGFEIPAAAVRSAVQDVEWPARLETIRIADISVLLDGAHNPAGARALADHVLDTYRRRLPMVVGAMRDKHLERLLSALVPAASHFIFTAASTPRAATPLELSEAAARSAPGIPASIEPQPTRAVMIAAAFGSPVVVAGSLYLAGEIRAARS
jgi:dihydrofolate synthase/folylpolyglutamate synthase